MKSICLLLVVFLLISFLTSTSYAWQARMGGMGDPYGLIADESDFLIHPAKIVNGQGVKFYGDYRFTYTGVLQWNNDVDVFIPLGVPLLFESYPRETSGEELRHEALVGSSFPLGPGRMGLFFTYDGMRGDYDGKDICLDPVPLLWYDTYDLESDLDNFAFRLLYGLPLNGFNLGGEVQIAYRQEENTALYDEEDVGFRSLYQNDPFGGIENFSNLFPFMIPYNSSYCEALFKGSLDGTVGPLDLEFTLRGGFLFGGNNEYVYETQTPVGNTVDYFDLDGSVEGWRLGGDLWIRYPLAADRSLPFLVRIDYQEKTRDGYSAATPIIIGFFDDWNYQHKTESLQVEVGGGLDKEINAGSRVAVGIYYNYLQGNDDFWLMEYVLIPGVGSALFSGDYSDYPASFEHRVMLRLAGELELSPAVMLRMGLAPFYGWVRQDFTYSYTDPVPFFNYTDDVSTDGYHWGIGASLGGTIQFKTITLEPFINGGWQQLHCTGDGDSVDAIGLLFLYNMSHDRDEWYIGGGMSILFDVP